jgi:hypothetical protein
MDYIDPYQIASLVLLQNNAPLDDFCGLSPVEMQALLYDPYGAKSPVSLRTDIEDSTLDAMPFFRLTEEFLRLIRQNRYVKLTPGGALPRKVLHELYAHRLITDEFIESGISKLYREQEVTAISTVHLSTSLSGTIRKLNGKLMLTRRGEKLLRPDERLNLFRTIFCTFTEKFAWSYNDGYHPSVVGQFGWGFTIYMVKRFGNTEQTVEFYAGKYLNAFPTLLDCIPVVEWSTPKALFVQCYEVRAFTRFLEWFGFVTVSRPPSRLDSHLGLVKRAELVEKVFKFG